MYFMYIYILSHYIVLLLTDGCEGNVGSSSDQPKYYEIPSNPRRNRFKAPPTGMVECTVKPSYFKIQGTNT